jgi:hypothetical protein
VRQHEHHGNEAKPALTEQAFGSAPESRKPRDVSDLDAPFTRIPARIIILRIDRNVLISAADD